MGLARNVKREGDHAAGCLQQRIACGVGGRTRTTGSRRWLTQPQHPYPCLAAAAFGLQIEPVGRENVDSVRAHPLQLGWHLHHETFDRSLGQRDGSETLAVPQDVHFLLGQCLYSQRPFEVELQPTRLRANNGYFDYGIAPLRPGETSALIASGGAPTRAEESPLLGAIEIEPGKRPLYARDR